MILLVMTDGRTDLLAQAVASAEEQLAGEFTAKVIHDDTGDDEYRDALRDEFYDFEIIGQPTRQGFGGAIRSAWAHISDLPGRFVFHLEDDFTFNEPVPLDDMARVLDRNPHLRQLALRRQPWNPQEAAAGGIVEQDPDAYRECSDGIAVWLEHRKFFTTNPSLYRRSLTRRGWPEGDQSEGRFGLSLFADEDATCGFWGPRDSAPKVHHIGDQRVGTGY